MFIQWSLNEKYMVILVAIWGRGASSQKIKGPIHHSDNNFLHKAYIMSQQVQVINILMPHFHRVTAISDSDIAK